MQPLNLTLSMQMQSPFQGLEVGRSVLLVEQSSLDALADKLSKTIYQIIIF